MPTESNPETRGPSDIWTDEFVSRLRELVARGDRDLAIAAALNREFGAKLTRSAVNGKCLRLNLRLNVDPHDFWTDAVVARLKELVARNDSGAMIAAALNQEFSTAFKRNAVIGKCRRLGLQLNGDAHRLAHQRMGGRPVERESRRQTRRTRQPKPPQVPRPRGPRAPTGPMKWPRSRGAVGIMRLKSWSCRWPYDGKPTLYCGHPVNGSYPYCLEHCFHAYSRWSRAAAQQTCVPIEG